MLTYQKLTSEQLDIFISMRIKQLLSRVVEEARNYGCGTVQITASDMGVLLYTDYGFVKNGNFMQYKL